MRTSRLSRPGSERGLTANSQPRIPEALPCPAAGFQPRGSAVTSVGCYQIRPKASILVSAKSE